MAACRFDLGRSKSSFSDGARVTANGKPCRKVIWEKNIRMASVGLTPNRFKTASESYLSFLSTLALTTASLVGMTRCSTSVPRRQEWAHICYLPPFFGSDNVFSAALYVSAHPFVLNSRSRYGRTAFARGLGFPEVNIT